MLVRVEQGTALELPVDVDQALAQFLERADGDRQSIDMGAAPALRRNAASDDELIVLERTPQGRFDLGPEVRILQFEGGGRARLALARADQIGRRLAAQDQSECGQEQALPRPRLSRPGAIPSLELDVHVLDESQVLHREFTQHQEWSDE